MDGKQTKLNQALAKEVRAERSARALTQEQLGEAAGISYSSIKRIERGQVDVGAGDLGAIAAVFSQQDPPVSPAELMHRAVTRAGGYETLLSEESGTTVDLMTHRLQKEAAAMSAAEIEDIAIAATEDAERRSPEPETP